MTPPKRYRMLLAEDRMAGYDVDAVAEIASVPAKTVRTWATLGLVRPSFGSEDPAERVYGLGDAVALRLVADLIELRVSRRIVRLVAGQAVTFDEGGVESYVNPREAVNGDVWWLVPATDQMVESHERRGVAELIRWFVGLPDLNWDGGDDAAIEDDDGDGGEALSLTWQQDGDLWKWADGEFVAAVFWPQSKVAGECVERAETWRRRQGFHSDELAPYM